MAEDQRPMTNTEIMTRVNQKVKESVSWYDSRLSKERQRVINYYNGVLPKRQHLGSSPYISNDVYDSVESMKSQLVETFSANPDNLISFPPRNAQDVEGSKQATAYTNYVVFQENDGQGMIDSATHDGLTARSGVVKIYWEECKDDTEEEFDGLSYQDVMALSSQEDITDLKADADDATGLFSGKLTRTEDKSQVKIDNVPPEEFGITPRDPYIHTADCCYHRTLTNKGDLKKKYPNKATEIDELHYDDDKGLDLGPEVLARNMPIETTQALDNPIQPEQEKVMVYESYVKMDLHDGKGTKLYKVVHVNETMLEEPTEVNRRPFRAFTPLPIPYMFYGNNFAARCIPYQNARTVLTRAILDHTAITTNPRWTVMKGGLMNPREMLENRLGGIVNTTRPDAVKALEQSPLNPFVFQTLEMLKSNKEESTGISALSQGLDKNAISTQNSTALVDNLVTLSQTRQKVIARQFAKFLSEVYISVYELVLENANKEQQKIIEVAGEYVPMSTKDWAERTKCSVALHLGYGERDRQVAKYATLYKELASDPALGTMFRPNNRFNLITDTMKLGGFQNFSRYITDPATVPPPQPDPIKMQEMQIEGQKAQAALITAQSNVQRNSADADATRTKMLLEELNLHLKSMLGARSEERKDAEVRNRIDVAQREVTMLEKTPISKESGVVSAH